MHAALYTGQVMHSRQSPVRHRFTYDVTALYIDLDELPVLAKKLRLLRIDRPGIFTFHQRDHGPRDGTPLRTWIDRTLSAHGIDIADGPVRLLCFPRMWGYVFNPLTVWFCYHRDGPLTAILYEVSNTFGQHHCYLIPVDARDAARGIVRQTCAKGFYVSPFLPQDATYTFRLKEPGDTLSVGIRYEAATGESLAAVQTGTRHPLTDGMLLRILARRPTMTFKVMAAIHWEALKLWRKGGRYHRRPDAPENLVSAIPENQENTE